jgi:hypothetical protein
MQPLGTLPDNEWAIRPHICRVCFGRVLRCGPPGAASYRCSNCGLTQDGAADSVLCMCGLRTRTSTRNPLGVNAGLRCIPNPRISPEMPSEIVAVHVGAGIALTPSTAPILEADDDQI